MSTDPNWAGYVQKKAFKTLTKASWKRRWIVFDAPSFSITWFESKEKASRPPKGNFNLDPNDLSAGLCEEHAKPFEIRIASKGQQLYMCCESSDDQNALLARIDAARRLKVGSVEHAAGGESLVYRTAEDVAAAGSGVFPGEPGKKVFTWGVGMLLGIGKQDISGMAVPQRVSTFASIPSVTAISAGPEHAAGVTDTHTTSLWGSNEFYQLAQGQDTASSPHPVPIDALAGKRVLSMSCGGSHTLAIVTDGSATSGAGALFAWGTGTVGQLGLGNTNPIVNGPSMVTTPPGADGKPSHVSQAFAGLVSSAAITATGDCFVWGDASAGRLGLPGIPDNTPMDVVPTFVNAAVVWSPTQLKFTPADVGMAAGATPRVVSVALGGAFSLYSIWTGSGPGCVLLASGALGWDITRDTYGYPPRDEAELNAMIDEEIKQVPRKATPTPVAPFGLQPTVLSAIAGARHAAVVAYDPMRNGAPRLYTAGKGWLGHTGTADSVLLERPTVMPMFQSVTGALADEDIVEAACGHSHTLARTADGRLYGWGRGDSGELGHGNLSDRSLPIPCRTIDGHYFTAVAAGSYYSVAVADAGYCQRLPPSKVVETFTKKYAAIAAAQANAASEAVAAAAAATAAAEAAKAAEQAEASKAAGGGGGGADKKKAAGGGGADNKKKKEEEAQNKARAAHEEGELPPEWSWDQTDEGEVYYIKPDGETQWEDPRDDWDTYWPMFM